MEQSETTSPSFYNQKSSFLQKPWVRFSFFFLIGGCFGAILTLLINTPEEYNFTSNEDVRGTVYNSSSFEKMKPADAIFFDNPVVKAAINVRYSTQLVEARLDLSSLYPVKLVVEFGYNDFRVLNVQNITVNDKSTTQSASNYVQIDNVGDNKYIIQLLNRNRLPHQITFKFYQNDMQVYSNSVIVNKE